MSFVDTLKTLGLFKGATAADTNPQVQAYGLDPATARMVGWQTLGNISQQLLALGQQMTPNQRANMLAQSDMTGGLQTNLYNAAQMKLLAQKRRDALQQQQRAEAAQAQLAEMIRRTPPGDRRNAAMFFLQAGDLTKAGEVLFGGQDQGKPPEMKTIRVGDKDVTYQWDPAQNAWVKFGEGVAFKPDAPPDGPKPSDRLALYKDYENAPETQSYNTLATTLGSLSTAINDNSKVSDLDFIYGVAKALDPTSVVRESEGQMVVDSQGLAPSVLGRLNSIIGGGSLTAQKRRELYALVQRRAGEYRKQAEARRNYTLKIGNGIIGEEDLRPLPPLIDLPPIPGAPQATAPGREDRYPEPELVGVGE